jgi:hypothetical protein
LPPNGGVTDAFLIRPDGRGVVFVADAHTDDVFELLAVPLGGGLPERLHRRLDLEADVLPYAPWNLAIPRGSRQVLFVADLDTDDVFELYESPLRQSSPGLTGTR